MPMQSDLVEVSVGGFVQRGWQAYSIDSDMMVPADAWEVRHSAHSIALPSGVVPGAPVQVRMVRGETSEVVLSGVLDDLEHGVRRDGQALRMSGRDGAGVLLDCSAAVVSMRSLTLADVVAKIVRPLGLVRVRIDAVTQLRREKVNIEPGDTAWDSLRRAAQANGLWPWFEPDGTLVVGGPDYAKAPVATLVLRKDGVGNNVQELAWQRAIHERYSQVTVLGQSQSTGSGDGETSARHNVKAVVKDAGIGAYRPLIVVDHEAVSEAIALARGRKIISDSRLKALTLTAVVAGHRTAAGLLWTPGQRVHVVSEPHGIDAVFFLMGRRLVCDRQGGQRTELRLKEDGVWTLDAHPSKRKHRRGKNSLPLQQLDLSGSGT